MYKPLLTAALCCCCIFSSAQDNAYSTPRKLRFGFNLGTNYALLQSKDALPENTTITNGFGGKLGLTMDYTLTSRLGIAPKIELAFNTSQIQTTLLSDTKSTYNVFANSLDVMSHFTYKLSHRSRSLYLLAGPNLRIPVEKKPENTNTFTTKTDLAIDFGIGFENPLKHFNIAPEIRYSMGLLNINNNPLYKSLYFHTVSLVVGFR